MEHATNRDDSGYPVYVESFDSDSRYRRVRLRGVGCEPLEKEEFVPRVRQVFPGIDLDDPDQVHWADRPGQWPRWHPGEA
ncbi:hypothetical protein [Streptomyces botrytidirepellens]|uniref:Uncharacterized protein n=1 Tax=Streptomyces botrytidirepellens TaxID=2486417 RepID=A0A3M8XA64_9ACTN|nr:hypothetical protein [Streptomyces botrytidirepellens]RNG39126.1 hypothetical protein EEJ42_00415 [Streptomyces botrytidirepellens]